VTLSNIPPEYQSAGYSLYVYLGAPSATAGLISSTAADWFGAINVGSSTNYYHAIDLALWDGRYVVATNTNPSDSAPGAANVAVFSGLNGDAVTIVASPHPLGLSGPVSLSGFQLVANVVQPVPLTITRQGGNLVLIWPGTWVLQTKSALGGPSAWSDISGATSGYVIPAPLQNEAYFRLRSP
jgi:hypothetical protein